MTETEALQETLAAEHAAVYVYALIGARTSQSLERPLYEAVHEAYVTHRDRRDDLIGRLAALGEDPVPAAAAFAGPAGLETLAGRTAAALDLESGCAQTYAALVGSSTGEVRSAAIGYLMDAAVRELGLGGAPASFPGADDLA